MVVGERLITVPKTVFKLLLDALIDSNAFTRNRCFAPQSSVNRVNL